MLKKLQPCEYVVPFVTCGRHGEFNYLVMELLGENISELRRRQASGRFSIGTTSLLAMQMIRAIEAVHNLGYLHRDIKPSNFAVGLGSRKGHVYMIDFGLSRRYVLPSGKVRPPRDQSGFRGTARYASINAHLSKDLARRDDLWSLLYMLIEFANGVLPWRRIKDKDQVGEMKIRCNTPELVADLPKEFLLLWEHLQTLRYEDKPDYAMLYKAFENCLANAGGSPDGTPFDWEMSGASSASRTRSLPRLTDRAMDVVCANLDSVTKSIALPSAMKMQMLELVCRMKMPLTEQHIMKLVDSATTGLDLRVLRHMLTPAIFTAILGRCSHVQRLFLDQVTDAQMVEVIKFTSGLLEISLVAPKKLLSLSKGIRPLFDKNGASLQRVHLSGEAIKDRIVEQVLKTCPLLEVLDLQGCKRVKGTFFSVLAKPKRPVLLNSVDLSGCELSKTGFKSLVKGCGTLKNIRLAPLTASFSVSAADLMQVLHRTPHLETFDLRCDAFELDAVLLELAKMNPMLSNLTLEGIGITDFGLQNVLQSCTRLRQLAIPCGEGVSDSAMHYLSKCCTNLTALKLHFINRANRSLVSEHALRSLLCSVQDLHELTLQKCLLLSLHSFPEEGLYTGIKKVDLSDCFQVDDMTMERMAQLCPNVSQMHLCSLNNLTSATLGYLSTWCQMLQDLSLLNCACFEDEAIVALLNAIPVLFIQLSRFPSPSFKPVDHVVHRTNVNVIFSSVSNGHRVEALEKKKLYGLI